MTSIDYLITIILILSTLISFIRGFCKEVLSIIFFILVISISYEYYYKFYNLFSIIQNDTIRRVTTYGFLFFLILISESNFNKLISYFINKINVSYLDKILGLIFGFIRGIVLNVLLVFFINFLSLFPYYN
ncbi:CvpA family protein [Buchnera aphidicola (Taiwanaphis decaspermi)]|uniref:CvpA family protein n=1 Tax=Buchnera aphidicola TaxID=9 RepID=UPI0031B85B92